MLVEDQRFISETKILDIYIKEKFNWETVNWCVVDYDRNPPDQLTIWLNTGIKPTFEQLKELSDFLNTEDITIESVICSPSGCNVLKLVNDDSDLDEFVYVQLRIKNWCFARLKFYLIEKQLKYKKQGYELYQAFRKELEENQ